MKLIYFHNNPKTEVNSGKLGIWRSPANEGLNMNNSFARQIEKNDSRNTLEKSINTIRAYLGKGLLIMGSRILNRNSKDWRYINIRGLANEIEDHVSRITKNVKKANKDNTAFNQVEKEMKEILESLWKRGDLVGKSQAETYFIEVLPKSRKPNHDNSNGIIEIKIGIAPSRPAEFIILDFKHILQSN